MVASYDPAVFAISETWLVPGSRFRVPGFSCLRDDRDDGYGGAAILIKSSVTYTRLTLPPIPYNINAVAAKIMDFTVLSIYVSDPHSIHISDLEHIFSALPGPFLILGDFNCHHLMWGSADYDALGCDLVDLMEDLNICLLNDGSPTRRTAPGRNASAVDLSLCSPNFGTLLSWSLLEDSHGSDHLPILISSPPSFSQPSSSVNSIRYHLPKADWDQFAMDMDAAVSEFPTVSSENARTCHGKYIDAFIASANTNIPHKKRYKTGRSSPPWWDSECSDIIRQRKDAEKAYCQNMSMDNFLAYKRTAALAKRLFKKKKRLGWINFCQSISPRTPAGVLWKAIKRYRGSYIARDLPSNDPSMWLTSFIDTLSPASVPHLNSLPSPYPPNCPPNNFDQPFSWFELLASLDHLKNSAPGPDNIPYAFLVNSGHITKKYFLDLINQFFDLGFVPEDWKKQIIFPLPKPGKDPLLSSSHRPIALSSCLLKILEHMIKKRLEWFVESKKILAKSQFGFRKGMGTMDSLSILTTDIRITLSRNEFLIGVFLDITSAYDSVILSLLRDKLSKLSLPQRLTHFICNFLMERSIEVSHNGSHSTPRLNWQGLPQGSVLSPLLYSLYTYDLEEAVSPFCSILQYADDIALYSSSRSVEVATCNLNQALFYLGEWLAVHGLSLSVSKCSVVPFTRKRSFSPVEVAFNDQLIPVTNQVKFLGVILDSHLSGAPHIDFTAQKCQSNINILRCLSGVWWGAHPYSQKLLYNAIIRSVLDYGSFILEPCSKVALGKLDRIQHQSLRVILGAMKSSPTNALQVEATDAPLSLRRQYLADRFFLRLSLFNDHPLLPKLQELSCLITDSGFWFNKNPPCLINSFRKFSNLPDPSFTCSLLPLFSHSYDALIFLPNIILNFGIAKNQPGANISFLYNIHNFWPGWTLLFTDSSRLVDNGTVGSAVWIPKDSVILSFKCPPLTSVFTGELIAILEAIKYVNAHGINKTIIFSDCLSGLQAIKANPFSSKICYPLVLHIRQSLLEGHLRNLDIALAWIPSHSGIQGNEIVDTHAKEAIEIGSLEHSHCYFYDLFSSATSDRDSNWLRLYERSLLVKGRHYGDIQPGIPSKPWFFRFRQASKQTTSVICRLRIGHTCTPSRLHRWGIVRSPLCSCGLEEGTADHIFLNCSMRSVSLYNILPPFVPKPTNLKTLLLLASSNKKILNLLIKYISKEKIKL